MKGTRHQEGYLYSRGIPKQVSEVGEALRKRLRHARGNLVVSGGALSLALGAYLWRLYILRVRYFDEDEFEHLHAAWCVSKGLLPYRDFFEHHTPWLYFFFAQFFRFYNVDTKFTDAQAFLFFARTWMWIFAGVILVLTFWLGNIWRDARVGCIAALFLGNTLMFLEKTIEVRPDVPSLAFWLACLVAVVRGIRGEETARKSRWRFAWSGAFLGAALMCTQKMLFALPGFGVAMLWYLIDPRSRGTRHQRFWNVACQVVGFCLPVLLTLGYFAVRGALGEFFEYNFLLNLRWKHHFPPGPYLKQLVKDNPILVALAVLGFFRALWGILRRERFQRGGEAVYVLSAAGLFGGLFLIQVPRRQYYLTFLALGAVFGADAFVEALNWVAAEVRGIRARTAKSVLYIVSATGAFAALIILVLRLSKPQFLKDHAYDWLPRTFHAELWLLALVLAAVCFLFRRENLASLVLVAGLSIYPFKIMVMSGGTAYPSASSGQYTNTTTLNQIRYVFQNTSPTDTCMDGWTGLGVFRPHAWFYWLLHDEMRAMLSERTVSEIEASLRSGSIAPKLIFYDDDLKGLSAQTAQFFESHYEPTGVELIQRRK